LKKIILILGLLISYLLVWSMSASPQYFTPSEEFHIVQPGDDLNSISGKYNISVNKLKLYNDLKKNKIFLGQRIYLIPKPQQWNQYVTIRDIPANGYHLVRPRQDIYLIARMYDLEIIELIDINDLASLKPQPGDKIYLKRGGKPARVTTSTSAVTSKPKITPKIPDLSDKKPVVMTGNSKLTLPVSGTVTSEFGLRNGRPHKGIDIANKKGTPILAVLAGKVAYAGRQRGYGNVVILEHANSVMTVYAHNEANLVRVDEEVKQSQPIATLGSSGVSTGAHLHFEYRKKGRAINPRDVLPQIK